jgi:hypothetical protein
MADVAEVPTLAPGVRLSEEMEESAFVDPQWLAQRDGKFVQLTELLYRVLAEIDGKRNLEQIAEAVGDAIDRDVTADNVRQLISLKLIPLGLVTKADGSVLRPSGEAEGAARSPLQVNLKMAMLSPRTIHPDADEAAHLPVLAAAAGRDPDRLRGRAGLALPRPRRRPGRA